MEATTEVWAAESATPGGVRRLAPPPRTRLLSAFSVVVVAAVAAAFWIYPLESVRGLETPSGWRTGATIAVIVLAALASLLAIPGIHAVVLSFRARRLESSGDIVGARHIAARAREKAQRTLGYALAAIVVLGLIMFLLTNNAAFVETFLSWEQIRRSASDIFHAFWLNLWIALASEALILVVALALALVRAAPGRAMAPLRFLAIAYIDVFRAIPLIILLYLVAFGIPIAEIPVLSDLPTPWLVVIGLTVTTSAYVAEVFRSGIETVHWSQTAAAKSLGFSTTQTWIYVVVPQAFRRVLPPLLSYFIGLQKDTALVLVVGTIDAFGMAKIYAGNYFNLSSVTFVAIVFILATIPQTRFVDYLIRRQARKTGVRAL
ncbi:MAG TPA: amino acid ABC transporter permease [Gaiella sp.]|jgi:polar amino acid transport system permease protein|nr:amino acid ABC transporter permease [Gaiella sp.]